jgi:hypothetical protein
MTMEEESAESGSVQEKDLTAMIAVERFHERKLSRFKF